MEWYKSHHIASDTASLGQIVVLVKLLQWIIYPKANGKIYLTKDFNKVQPVILKVAHSQSEARLFWYVDNVCMVTKPFHEMPMNQLLVFITYHRCR
jgi:penicillin-binding protein 1C